MDRLNNRLDADKERLHELEDRAEEITQDSAEKDKVVKEQGEVTLDWQASNGLFWGGDIQAQSQMTRKIQHRKKWTSSVQVEGGDVQKA